MAGATATINVKMVDVPEVAALVEAAVGVCNEGTPFGLQVSIPKQSYDSLLGAVEALQAFVNSYKDDGRDCRP